MKNYACLRPAVIAAALTSSILFAAPGLAQFSSYNVSLYSHLDLNDLGSNAGSSCWGYVSPSGREYALIGLFEKMSVVEITNPSNPVIVGSISHANSNWCELKTYGHYAYVVNENSGGMDVVDLSNVDGGVVTLVRRLTTNGLDTSHTVSVNTDSGYLYLNGSNLNGGAPVAYSLADPALPVEVGRWTQASAEYIHDSQIISYTSGPYAGREIMFAASEFRGLDVLDVTNKSNISLLSRTPYPNVGYCHQAWTEDLRFLYVDDEFDEGSAAVPTTRTIVFDITNLSAPFVATTFTSGQTTTDHNLYVRDCVVYEANYQSGLRIFAVHDPFSAVEVGWFDTYPEGNGYSTTAAWNNYPFFPSGTVIVSDIVRGLFVLDVSDALAAAAAMETVLFEYPDGRPELIAPPGGNSFTVEVSDRCGASAVAGTGTLVYDRGFGPLSIPMSETSPNVYEAVFPPTLCGTDVPYRLTVESSAGGTMTNPMSGSYTAYSGEFMPFLTDEMEANPGWTVGLDSASSGNWVRGDPNGTTAQPSNDHTPAPGVNCWFTGQNTPLQPDIGDVDAGTTVLTSPQFDLSAGDARVTYYRWYFEANAGGGDGFLAEISNDNGQTWTPVESLTDGSGGWQQIQFVVSDVIPASGQVRLRFSVSDGVGSDDRIEAAIDDLTIETLVCAPQDADVDNDTHVDLADYALIQACHTGAGACLCHPALYDDAGAPECIGSDLELDGDVDLSDYDLFADSMTGP